MIAATPVTQVLVAVGLLMGAVIALGVILLMYRSRVLSSENAAEAQRGLLDDLRAMRDRGEITLEEYDAARRSLAARLKGEAPPPSMSRPARGEPEAMVAPPGYDLTGRPLPRPSESEKGGGVPPRDPRQTG